MTYSPRLPLQQLSTGNSSEVALGASASFTGAWELVEYPDALTTVVADQPGTLFFEFSHDGATVHSTFPPAGFEAAAGVNEFHTAVKGYRYFRCRFVNGATPQGSMTLRTSYGTYAKQPNAPLNAPLGSDSDATTVRAVLVGDDIGGQGFANVRTTTGGGLLVSDTRADIARGLVPDVETLGKFGINTSASAGDDVWSGNAPYLGFDPGLTPGVVTIDAASGDDDVAGTGMRSVTVIGLDAAGAWQTEDIDTNGGSTSVGALTFSCVFTLATNHSVSGGGVNAGLITASIGGTTVAEMPTGYARSLLAAFRVPASVNGRTVTDGTIRDLRIPLSRDGAQGGSALVTLRIRPDGSNVWETRDVFVITTSVPGVLTRPITLAPLDSVKVTVESLSTTGMSVKAEIDAEFFTEAL